MNARLIARWIFIALLLLVVVFIASCEQESTVTEPEYAKGGNKGKPVPVMDSLTLTPSDTTVFVNESFMLVVGYWYGDQVYLKRQEDGLLYIADMENGCLRDRPKPINDDNGVVLSVVDVSTGEVMQDSVGYIGMPGLEICPR